jgi:hypothetical protein
VLVAAEAILLVNSALGQTSKVNVRWVDVTRESNTAVSMEVCVEPPMRRGSPIHDQLFEAIVKLSANYVRLAPWYPYPKLAVTELEPPYDGKTSWDFSLLDPIVDDFMRANAGRPVVMDISTIPEWMYETDKPVPYPSNPDEIVWNYEQGTKLRDPTMKEVAGYWARVASWYTLGGFKDEYGRWHQSGHHYKFDYWEVLNEVDHEHQMTPESYTALYDAIVTQVREVAPNMKFVGLALTPNGPINQPQWFDYFLDPKRHKPGIPLDAISYHFYAWPDTDESPEIMSHTLFLQADNFVNVVRYVEAIRQRRSPRTLTMVNEVGTILPNPETPQLMQPIPTSYWNLSGAMYAYVFGQLAQLGIDMVYEAELIDYPGQYAGTTLVDWNSGQPNSRYWVLKLLRDNFNVGDKLVKTQVEWTDQKTGLEPPRFIYAQGFLTSGGKRKILLVNKRNRSFEVVIPQGTGAQVDLVDQITSSEPPHRNRLASDQMILTGLAVAVVNLRQVN